MSSNIKKTLEQSLQSYRIYSATKDLSWKQHYATEKFSNNDLLLCDIDEQQQFFKRLKECDMTVCNNVKQTIGTQTTLYDVITSIYDEKYKFTPKSARRVVFANSTGTRPIGKRGYEEWNGFQIIDMDIKDKVIAEKLKTLIFNKLCNYNWFVGVVTSSSGKGLHIYTKITVPEEADLEKQKILYITNFRHKYSFVYLACISGCESIGFTETQLKTWMDMAMFKPQQGAFISYDEHPLISTQFFEDYIYICFDNIDELGFPDLDWVTYPALKEIFKRWEWFDVAPEPEIEILESGDTNNIKNKIHYKHNERWKLANTLVKIYGANKGYEYLRKITSNNVTDKELLADCTTAARHNKNVDSWAIKQLNKVHGFKIKIDVQNSEITQDDLYMVMDSLDNPNNLVPSRNYIRMNIKKNQYLGDILDNIINNLGHITLLEAGPGLGKTEMVKQLVTKGEKIMMVMPFTSTIKSKVEEDPLWYYSYGSRKPKLDTEHGLSLTLDKFSKLNIMDIRAAGFTKIFIDESHLLFVSGYRNIMSRVVDMISSSEIPVILMSGTPTGELIFFDNITHIHIVKEETRLKDLYVNIVDNPKELIYFMAKEMATDIVSNKRILYPSNLGVSYSKRVCAAIKYFLVNDYQDYRDINFKYYKKSQIGEKFMDDINFKKTIKNIDVLMCTSYLSVGVDILDKYNFTIYFSDLCAAAEADQWSNRLRSNDLHLKFYISKHDSEGNLKNINKYNPINFKLSEDELRDMHSILKICNDAIERSPMVNMYNPLISSIVTANNYVVFDILDQKYKIDETAYKICQFENKYRDFTQQLPVFLKGMQNYGYSITSRDLSVTEGADPDVFTGMKECMQEANWEQHFRDNRDIDELLNLIDFEKLEIYHETIKGLYDIKKGPVYSEDFGKNTIYVKNVEVFEKVLPLFLSFNKHFDVDDCKHIFATCQNEKGVYNMEALRRYRTLFNLVFSDENKKLDLPIKQFMIETYAFCSSGRCTKLELTDFIKNFVVNYATNASDDQIIISRSPITLERMENIFNRLFRCLVKMGKKSPYTLELIEILWKTKDQKRVDGDDIYILEDFLDLVSDSNP